MIFIPGWIVKIDKDQLTTFKIHLRFDQTVESLKYFISKGEHNSSIPFGIYKDRDEEYRIILRKDETQRPECILIGSNIIEIKSEYEDSGNFSNFDLMNFLKLYVEFQITSNNPEYIPSNLVKTYLGQYSKGRLSKRKDPLETKSFAFPYRVNFNLCEAEEFGILPNSNNNCIVTYTPHFEIFDDIFHLPQSKFIHNRLFDEWKSKMQLNIEMIVKRFLRMSDLFLSSLENQDILKFVDYAFLQEETCPYPIFKTSLNNLETNGMRPFSDIYFNHIYDKINSEEHRKITILFDLTSPINVKQKFLDFLLKLESFFDILKLFILIPDNVNSEKVNDFAKQLSLSNFNSLLYSELGELNKYENILFIINDKMFGSDYLYDRFKETIKKSNKVLKYSTIEEEPDETILCALLYLSLLFRDTHKLILEPDLNDEALPTISFMIEKNIELEFTNLESIYIDSGNKFIINRELLPLIERAKQNPGLNKTIIEFIKIELQKIISSFPNKKIIIYFKDSWDLRRYIHEAIDDLKADGIFYLVLFQDIPLKLFSFIDDQDGVIEMIAKRIEIPYNGTFFEIKFDTSSYIVLVTNGQKDNPNPKIGTPNPVVFEILGDHKAKEISNIVCSIYLHSFLHPTSFSKSVLPIEMYMLNKMKYLPLWTKIQKDNIDFEEVNGENNE